MQRVSPYAVWQAGEGIPIYDTLFVQDMKQLQLKRWARLGADAAFINLEGAGESNNCYVAEIAPGTYKKADRHGAGANVIILSGQGFTLLWEDGKWDQRVKVDWKPGSIVVPPSQWFHQHFNSGPEPARYLALRWGSNRYGFRPDGPTAAGGTDTSVKHSGDQIEYADENPEVHRLFESEMKKTGAICHMKQLVQVCAGGGHED